MAKNKSEIYIPVKQQQQQQHDERNRASNHTHTPLHPTKKSMGMNAIDVIDFDMKKKTGLFKVSDIHGGRFNKITSHRTVFASLGICAMDERSEVNTKKNRLVVDMEDKENEPTKAYYL